VGGFDLIYDQSINFKSTQCYLGCHVKKPVITVPRTMGKKSHTPKESQTPKEEEKEEIKK
jgi:hypothetical protein